MLALVFGHTVHALTTVLVSFMAGLALGGYLGGRWAAGSRFPVRTYGFLELGIGLAGLLTPGAIALAASGYLFLARSSDLSPHATGLMQFFLCSAVLLIPTTLMGATFPVLARHAAEASMDAGGRIAALYTVNTVGAVLGVFFAGFELLPRIGSHQTLLAAASLNFLAAAIILLWAGGLRALDRNRPSRIMAGAPVSTAERVLLAALAVSGAVSMIYEIAWSRALTLVVGSSTYAASAMLLAFLIGIGGGSAWFTLWSGRRSRATPSFALLQLAIAVSAAAVIPFFDRLPDLFLRGFRMTRSPDGVIALEILLSIVAMAVPAFWIGATFPCAVREIARGDGVIASQVGRAYACNTTGAIAGAFAAGFLLIPAIGIEATIRAGIGINLLLGAILIWGSVRRAAAWAVTLAVTTVGVAALFLLPFWDRQVMSSGVAFYAGYYSAGPAGSWRDRIRTERLLFYEDGIGATVTVHESEGRRMLRINGKTDATNAEDLHTQLMLGHLPVLLHPDPKTALVIGLGSGATVAALSLHPLQRIDVVEIEPAVIRASAFFRPENRGALEDPRVAVVVEDARSFLQASDRRYDLIASEPSNPWIGGVASLFTVEFIRLASEHLTPGGIMVQWIHGYAMAPDDLRMVVRSFQTVFPEATLWTTFQGDYLLVGSLHPIEVDLDRLRAIYARNADFRQDMNRIHLRSPEAILSDFYLDGPELARFSVGARLNTDDLLPLEFSAPRNLYRDTLGSNYSALRAVRRSGLPPIKDGRSSEIDAPETRFDLAVGFLGKGMIEDVLEQLDVVLARDPAHSDAHTLRERILKGETGR